MAEQVRPYKHNRSLAPDLVGPNLFGRTTIARNKEIARFKHQTGASIGFQSIEP